MYNLTKDLENTIKAINIIVKQIKKTGTLTETDYTILEIIGKRLQLIAEASK